MRFEVQFVFGEAYVRTDPNEEPIGNLMMVDMDAADKADAIARITRRLREEGFFVADVASGGQTASVIVSAAAIRYFLIREVAGS
jgi:hypothetical protein